MQESASFNERLKRLGSQLRPSELRVAEFINLDPERAASASITESAIGSETSESTVNRLARKLGYVGFVDMKMALWRDVLTLGIKNIPRDIGPKDPLAVVADKLSRAKRGAIEETVATLDYSQVARAVERIAVAKHTYFFGIGGSGYVADIAQHLFLKAGVRSTAYGDGYLQAVAAAILGPGDVVVAVSHTGDTADVVNATRLAQQNGAATVAVTGNPASLLCSVSDIVLVTASHEEPIYGDLIVDKVCQLLVIDLLYVGVVLQSRPMRASSLEATARAIQGRAMTYDSGAEGQKRSKAGDGRRPAPTTDGHGHGS